MIVLFDVNGTLLDIEALKPEITHIFGRKVTIKEWLNEVLLYSMALTQVGEYRDFADIGEAVLLMTAIARQTRLSTTM